MPPAPTPNDLVAKHRHKKAIDAARRIIKKAVPSAAESVKWNSPSFATSEHFATFFLRARSGFQVVLHLGAKGKPGTSIRDQVSDPAGLLEWRGADRAVVTFLDEEDVAAKSRDFAAIVREWVRFI